MASFTRSLPSSVPKGRLPTKRFSCSAETMDPMVFFAWSPARWGSRSPTVNWGSPGASPMRTGTTVPSRLHHHSVEGQGNGGPLILLDPPIIVGFAVGHLLLLIQRILLQVQAGGVDVGRPDHRPLVQALLADHRQQEGLAPVVPVHLVPGPEFLPPDQGAEPGGFRQADGIVHALPLGLALIQKGLIAGAIGLDVLLLPRGQTVITVGGSERRGLFSAAGAASVLFSRPLFALL